MKSTPEPADWSLWRSFAAVAATGSLSAAARQLRMSQPTLGRHIDALEQQLGVILFERTLRGLRPTETALRLVQPVAAAGEALAEAALVAAGAQEELSGSVRITASAVFSHYLLPELIAPLRDSFPRIALELVSSDSPENLLLREADIAIRMFRPRQLDLITRRIGETPLVTCAHQRYLERRGTPLEIEALLDHDIVGLDRSELIIDGARMAGFSLARDDFVLRSDSQTLVWELTRAGLGIGFAQVALVERTPGMQAILPQLRLPSLEIWLTTHRELFTNRRIRVIFDQLALGLAAMFGHPDSAPHPASQ